MPSSIITFLNKATKPLLTLVNMLILVATYLTWLSYNWVFLLDNLMPVFLLTALSSLLSYLPGALGNYFQKKQEIESIKLETERQLAIAQQQLLMEQAKDSAALAQITLQATGSWFKYFTFIMWFGPFIVGLVSPETAHRVFINLAGMPDWYVQSVVLIMFTIWGINVSAPVVNTIFSGLQDYLSGRRDYKLEAKKITTDKKSFYEGLRAAKGVITEADVKKYDPIIDKMDQQQS